MKMLSRPFSILLPATPLVLAACIMLGSGGIGFPDISTEAGWNIFLLRLNRIITAFVVGAALSAAGTVFQAVLRNALAEPYVLGVSSGAALGSAIAILTGINAFSIFVMPSIAFTMAALTLFIVFSLASGRSASPSVYGLILSGVIVSSVCSSLLMFLISVAPSRGLHNIMWWMLGNLEPSSIKLLAWSSAIILVAFLGAWALAPELNALTLGREAAHFLGIRTDFAMIASSWQHC